MLRGRDVARRGASAVLGLNLFESNSSDLCSSHFRVCVAVWRVALLARQQPRSEHLQDCFHEVPDENKEGETMLLLKCSPARQLLEDYHAQPLVVSRLLSSVA